MPKVMIAIIAAALAGAAGFTIGALLNRADWSELNVKIKATEKAQIEAENTKKSSREQIASLRRELQEAQNTITAFVQANDETAPYSERKYISSLPNSIFDMTKAQLLAYCEEKNILIDKELDSYIGHELTHFEWNDLQLFRVVWREDYGNHYIDSIWIGNMSVKDSIEGAKPVLEAWKLIQPDIVSLFQKLREDCNNQGITQSAIRWYQGGPYAYGYGANNKFYVDYVGPKSAISELNKQAVECATIYLSWFKRIKDSNDKIEQKIKDKISDEEFSKLLIDELFWLETAFENIDIYDMGEDYIKKPDFFYDYIPPDFHEDAKSDLLKTAGAIKAISNLSMRQISKKKFEFSPFPELIIYLSLTGGNAYEKIAGRYTRLEGYEAFSALPHEYQKQLEEITLLTLNILMIDK